MLTREVLERAGDFRVRVAGARFRRYEWQFLAGLDGRATVGEILIRLGLEESEMTGFIARQIESGSIVPSLMTYEEFTRSSAIQSDKDALQAASSEPGRTPAPLVFTLSASTKSRPQNGQGPA